MKHKRPASTLLAFTLGLGLMACGQAKQSQKVDTAEITITPSAPDSPAPSTAAPSSDGIFDLDEKAEYEDGIEVSLSRFSRGTSSDTASPENAPYVAFTVKIMNGKTTKMDLSEAMVDCMTGVTRKELTASEEVFDYDQKFTGTPDAFLLPGDQTTMRIACVMKGSESELQVDISPDWESEAVTFHGKVARDPA